MVIGRNAHIEHINQLMAVRQELAAARYAQRTNCLRPFTCRKLVEDCLSRGNIPAARKMAKAGGQRIALRTVNRAIRSLMCSTQVADAIRVSTTFKVTVHRRRWVALHKDLRHSANIRSLGDLVAIESTGLPKFETEEINHILRLTIDRDLGCGLRLIADAHRREISISDLVWWDAAWNLAKNEAQFWNLLSDSAVGEESIPIAVWIRIAAEWRKPADNPSLRPPASSAMRIQLAKRILHQADLTEADRSRVVEELFEDLRSAGFGYWAHGMDGLIMISEDQVLRSALSAPAWKNLMKLHAARRMPIYSFVRIMNSLEIDFDLQDWQDIIVELINERLAVRAERLAVALGYTIISRRGRIQIQRTK